MINSPKGLRGGNNENTNPHHQRLVRMSADGYKRQQLVERIKRMALQEAKEYGNRVGSLDNKKK